MVRKKSKPVRGRQHPEDRLRPKTVAGAKPSKRANNLWKYFRNSTNGVTHTMHIGGGSYQPLLFMKNVKKRDFVASPTMIAEMEAFYQQYGPDGFTGRAQRYDFV